MIPTAEQILSRSDGTRIDIEALLNQATNAFLEGNATDQQRTILAALYMGAQLLANELPIICQKAFGNTAGRIIYNKIKSEFEQLKKSASALDS